MTRILAILTGGTIGMTVGPEGLFPVRGIVERAIRQLSPPDLQIVFERLDRPRDSADIGAAEWNRIIALVSAWRGDGVIITHGTDTMAFTAAALAFALHDVEMPVLLCGAMTPLGVGEHAEQNLRFALKAVKHGPNGVWLAFNGRLMHGAALVKRHSSDNDAFREADPAPEMAMIPAGKKRFGPVRLAILSLSPGLPHPFLEAALATLDGAVLRIYGAGTVQNDPCLLATLAAAIGDGRRVVAVSQCAAGGLSPGAYAAGSELWRIGVENGGVLTAEAALVRLWLEMSV